MTETSTPWGGTTLGDAGPYSDDVWSDIWRQLFTRDRTQEGVLTGILNELPVTGVTSPVSVDTGAAVVDGKFYTNDASVSVVVPTPAVSTRIDRIVLEKDFAAQTVRITRVAGVEGGGVPALTQVDGTTWQIPLAQASITTGGTITVTDEREFVTTPMAALQAKSQAIEIATGAFSVVHGVSEYVVDGEGSANDVLTTINGGYTDQIITLRAASGVEIQLDHGAGNLALARDFDWWLIDVDRFIMLRFDGSNWIELFPDTQRFATIAYIIDGGGAELLTGEKTNINVPIDFDAEILTVRAMADQSGSVVVDEWVDDDAAYPPTVADTIVAAAPITIAADDFSEDTTLTGWTTRLTAGETMRPNVNSVTDITAVTITHLVTRL